MKKWITILAIAMLEILAVIGTLPLLYVHYRYVKESFWEVNDMALPAFLILAAGATVYYTRHESRTVRVVAPIIIVGALLLTITAVQALT